MDSDYVRIRITELRMQKGISEYKMSLDLGHSKGYIQGISSGRALPSLPELFAICEYFGISPKDFFDDGQKRPVQVHELLALAERLGAEDLELLRLFAERLGEA